jgi:hypothetical protein
MMANYIAKSITNCRGYVDYDDLGEFDCENLTEALGRVMDEEELAYALNWADNGNRTLSQLGIDSRSAVMLDGEETVTIVGEEGPAFDELYGLALRVLNGDESCVDEFYENCLV